MAVFLTGATGYVGSYIAHGLLTEHADRVALLVRAKDTEEAEKKLWKSLQLHFDFSTFHAYLRERIDLFLGDLTEPDLGLETSARKRLVRSTDSIIHCAASLNRKSEKACLNVNLRGTLEVIKVARAAREDHGLRRFSDVSTVAVAGTRNHETVTEDRAVDWSRSDYDPYGRTKKFCEHMAYELLPDISVVVFRPSIILGDSRFPQTTQFDMVRAFVFLAQLPVLPFDRRWRLDIVNADYVAKAVVRIHQTEKPRQTSYHLSSGAGSLTYGDILQAMYSAGFRMRHVLAPGLLKPFSLLVNGLAATPRSLEIAPFASLLKVFLPYLTYDTVFDNSRAVAELGEAPVPFKDYALPLLRFAKENHFTYPYKPWGEVQSQPFNQAKVA